MRSAFFSVALLAAPAFAADGLAAVQLCFDLPLGVELFTSAAQPHSREVSPGVFMLDLDVLFDGRPATKLTRGKGACVRAWLPPRRVRSVSLDLQRLPLNLVSHERSVDLKLVADRWTDGGSFTLEQEPFATARIATGAATFVRQTPAGEVTHDPTQLPAGRYVVTHAPPALAEVPCPAKVELFSMGAPLDAKKRSALEEHYAATFLPELRQKHACHEAEELMLEVLEVDGVLVRPDQPKLSRRVVEERLPRYELHHDGRVLPLEGPVTVEIAPGQHLQVVKAGGALGESTPPITPGLARR